MWTLPFVTAWFSFVFALAKSEGGERGCLALGFALLDKLGQVRWYTFRPPDKRRPVLILTRNEVMDQLNEIIVVPATRTIRGLTTERWSCDRMMAWP